MSDILEKIAESTRARVARAKLDVPEDVLIDRAFESLAAKGAAPSFTDVLAAPGMSFICECKKASPSKGVIAEDFRYITIAKEYEKAGASAISVLTEPEWFQGDLRYLDQISREVSIPLLRKDFTISPYMIDGDTLATYRNLAESLGMAALVEAHDEDEVKMALDAGARIIGVNNRDLRTFEVNASNCLRLRDKVPEGVLFVAESGIKTNEDINLLLNYNVDAVLIGEAMMTSPDKTAFLADLRGD